MSWYAAASPDCALSGDGRDFSRYVAATYGFSPRYVWAYIVKQVSRDDGEAVERLRCLFAEFAEAIETRSAEEVKEEIRARGATRVEGEPERIWRKFSRALLRGRQDEIRPLIHEHPNAAILWAGAYPEEVAGVLMEMWQSEPIAPLSGSEDEGEVTLMTAEFGPVSLKRIDGHWSIDATRVIRSWKSAQEPGR